MKKIFFKNLWFKNSSNVWQSNVWPNGISLDQPEKALQSGAVKSVFDSGHNLATNLIALRPFCFSNLTGCLPNFCGSSFRLTFSCVDDSSSESADVFYDFSLADANGKTGETEKTGKNGKTNSALIVESESITVKGFYEGNYYPGDSPILSFSRNSSPEKSFEPAWFFDRLFSTALPVDKPDCYRGSAKKRAVQQALKHFLDFTQSGLFSPLLTLQSFLGSEGIEFPEGIPETKLLKLLSELTDWAREEIKPHIQTA